MKSFFNVMSRLNQFKAYLERFKSQVENKEPATFSISRFLKEYYTSYKRWLAALLGKDSISNVSSLIFMVLILSFILLILLLAFLILSSMFSETLHCMDSLTEAHNQLLAKITKAEGDIQYYSQQAKEADLLFKQALRDNLSEEMTQERLIVKKESETNLNIEQKVLKTLKNRLASGNFDSSLSTSSSLGKRNFEE